MEETMTNKLVSDDALLGGQPVIVMTPEEFKAKMLEAWEAGRIGMELHEFQAWFKENYE